MTRGDSDVCCGAGWVKDLYANGTDNIWVVWMELCTILGHVSWPLNMQFIHLDFKTLLCIHFTVHCNLFILLLTPKYMILCGAIIFNLLNLF